MHACECETSLVVHSPRKAKLQKTECKSQTLLPGLRGIPHMHTHARGLLLIAKFYTVHHCTVGDEELSFLAQSQ